LLTEVKAFRGAGLKNEGQNGDDAEETARHDEVDDVVERFAAQVQSERDSRERSVATVVPDL